jgi:hypothetical protein
MNLSDFSNNFDTLSNSYSRIGNFGDTMPDIRFDEHEKSVFLTQAQEEIVISLYSGKNPYGESFEQTEELRRYLAPLLEEAELRPIESSNGKPIGMGSNSTFFTLPNGANRLPAVWFITYESVAISNGKCESMTSMDVYPVRQDEYNKIKKNPFRGANDRRALRLDLSEGNVEIICKYPVSSYYLRYLRKPNPIVLSAMDADAAIEGVTTPTECELPESLHQRILDRAVIMALQSKGININENK